MSELQSDPLGSVGLPGASATGRYHLYDAVFLIIGMCVDELSTVASTCPFTSNQHDRTHATLVCFQNLTAPGCRAGANAANSDAETTTATDCWKQQSVPENFSSPERKLITGIEKHRNEQASTSNSRHRNRQCGSP